MKIIDVIDGIWLLVRGVGIIATTLEADNTIFFDENSIQMNKPHWFG